jgi:tRNA U55 pseudouridine synthase TruB
MRRHRLFPPPKFLRTDKVYKVVVRFGITTDSDDMSGKVLSRSGAPNLSRYAVEAVLPRCLPPPASAARA